MSIQKVIKSITVSMLFAVGLLSLSIPAQAAMVGTAQIVGDANGQIISPKIMQQKRDWIQTQLQQAGVSRVDSALRVSSMSDDQVMQIHQGMQEMPAGAGAAGTIAIILLVLVVTDLMGATDIFPFIRPMEK